MATETSNWLGQENPWNLQPPPEWWLRKLALRDPDLRVLPGLTNACYRIARVSKLATGLKPLAHDTETARMVREGVIPVVSLLATVTWNNDFFQWLDDHDTWKFGGSKDDSIDKAISQIESNEQAAESKLAADEGDELEQRAVSGYHALLSRAGRLVFVRNPNSETSSRTDAPARTPAP